jgi:hypothetical protein
MLQETALCRPTAARVLLVVGQALCMQPMSEKKTPLGHPVWKGSQISLRDYFFVTWI